MLVSSAEAREQISELINRTAYAKERIVITRRGKRVAAVVPLEDLELLERLENEDDIRAADEALADIAEHGAVPWEQVKAEDGV